MPALLESAVENSCKVFFPVAFVTVFRTVSFWEGMRVWVAPRSTTSGRLDWRGVLQKMGSKTLERLRVRGQIIDNKRLTVFFATFVYTAPLDHDLVCLIERARVRCHNQGVEMRTAR
jgi:hypothetical protein